MRQPLSFYIERYNLVSKSRQRADYRFSKAGLKSLLQYIEWEKEDAIKEALAKPQLEILKAWRFKDVTCFECSAGGWWGGSAMTSWVCEICKNPRMHGSTATPRICTGCAITTFQCQRCVQSLDKDL